MKKLSYLLISGLFFLGSNAYADSSSTANALSTANANAMNGIGIGGNSGAAITLDQQFNSTGSAIPPTLPGMPGTTLPTPQIFSGYNNLSNPTNINGIAASLYLKEKCKPVYTKNSRSSVDVQSGATGNTKIVFTAYPDYKNYRYTKSGPEKVLPYLPTDEGNYVCLGTIMTTAQKGSEDVVDINVIGSDTVNYILDHTEGYSEVYAFCPKQTIGTAVGVSTSGSGFSLGGAAAGLASGNPATAVLLGAALSGSNSKGSTHPDGREGHTCWVFGKPKTPESGVHFSSGEYDQYLAKIAAQHTQSQGNAGNGPKLEATK